MVVVVLDVEILHGPEELPRGWDDKARMGVTVVAVWSSDHPGEILPYTLEPVEGLAPRLLSDGGACRTLDEFFTRWCGLVEGEGTFFGGFNLIGFDLPVLDGEWGRLREGRGALPYPKATPPMSRFLDLLHEFDLVGARWPKLDTLMDHNLGRRKATQGKDMPPAWATRNPAMRRAVVEHCVEDVLATAALLERTAAQGWLWGRDREVVRLRSDFLARLRGACDWAAVGELHGGSP